MEEKIIAEMNIDSYKDSRWEPHLDITDQQKAERELQQRSDFNKALFEYNPVETIVVDRQGKIIMVNMAKRNSGDRVPEIGEIMYKDYAGWHKVDMYANLMDCIKSGKVGRFPELQYGGVREKVLSITIAPFPEGAIITSEDITQRKNAEDQLKQEKIKIEALLVNLDQAYEKLRTTQDELLKREKISATGMLAAGVAHEIRNPLAVIGMTVQYLQSKFSKNDPKREYTEAIIKKVDRLDRVTRELSDYGRTVDLNVRRHNLKRCLDMNVSLIKPQCKVQKIKVVKRYAAMPLVEIDDEQMDKVFFNIMDNAVKVMPDGGIINITTEFDKETETVFIKIHNNGPTIKKEALGHIFEPFYTLRKQGTGLGLAIVQNVILKHGGEINVESKSSGRDKGVTFIIRLPLRPRPLTKLTFYGNIYKQNEGRKRPLLCGSKNQISITQ